MKYLVTVKVLCEFNIEVSAKDEESAQEKAVDAWEKISAIQIAPASKLGKFDLVGEEVEFEVDSM